MHYQILQGTFVPRPTLPPLDATKDFATCCLEKGCASEEDLATIYALPNPPLVPLTVEDLYVRRCRLAGTAVDQKGGCFRKQDLPLLLKLVQGAPALIGHNHQSIAIARFFGGNIEQLGEYEYIVPKLYWLKDHSRAEDLRLEIDGGLVTEASIAFVFQQATCNLCERDLRLCQHQVGEWYDGVLCHYWYDGIESVLEGSLVYRGAEPFTAFLPNQLPSSLPPSSPQTPNQMLLVKWNKKVWKLVEYSDGVDSTPIDTFRETANG
ncbi:MAG: hypothetical protein N2450_07745 [bacterium]|nr:hypothetical protein [bacterium]